MQEEDFLRLQSGNENKKGESLCPLKDSCPDES
jgi:hypothetical protein